ncbi:MAG: hypothetical protein B6D37_12845 [Sphingobacteriales bacterium UTBCD1]|nr:MAG: hypothetical protein B6D37_12845 [Sphingobacteriales bacterium UTBCD1]
MTRVVVESVGRVIAGSEARVLCESSDEAQVIARSEARELWESSDEAIFLVCWVRAFSECSLLRQWGMMGHNEFFSDCLAKTNSLF